MPDVLVAKNLSKSFGAIAALRDVSIAVGRGEIRAVCGENGAGKSTLVKILAGIYRPDAGTIEVDGIARDIRSPQAAQACGLALVAQELSVAPHLSVYDNIWLGSRRVPLLHRRRALRDEARTALATLGIGDFDLDRPVGTLAIGQRQLVEIARLIARDARLLILDEPTASLTDAEIARMFAALRRLKAEGRSILFITHRLGEVFDICDQVTVLRNGEHVATAPTETMDRTGLIEAMLGRRIADMYPRADETTAAGALVVERLSIPGVVQEFSMMAPRGKIVCVAGQIGSGAQQVVRAMAGLVPEASGSFLIDRKPVGFGSVPRAIANGILFVSEDRAGEGVFLNRSVLDNLVAMRLARHRRLGILSWRELRVAARRLAERVRVDRARLPSPAGNLSGGNQQKLLFARNLEHAGAGVLLLNEPTRGVDVGARAEIYRLMREFCALGYVLVMASSDLEEVLGMADAIVTMYRGRVVSAYDAGAVSMAAVLADITHPSGAAAGAAA